MTAPRPTEAECQTTIIEAARLAGWLVHHARPARSERGWATPIQGHAGFPDLVLVHPLRGLLAIELKRRPNKVTPEQHRWLVALRLAGVDARVVWVPDEMDALIAELTAPVPFITKETTP